MPGKYHPPLGTPCKICNRTDEQLSVRKLCEACAGDRVQSAIDQMTSRQGPVYEKWLFNLTSAMLEIASSEKLPE